MVSAEFLQSYDPMANHAEADLELLPKEHLAAQALIQSVGDRLVRYHCADRRDVFLGDVALSGSVPLMLQGLMGVGYKTMDVSIAQNPSHNYSPSLQIALKDSRLSPNTLITTDSNRADSVHEKTFWVQRAGAPASDVCYGDSVGDLLDGVLKTNELFAKATDPRKRPLSVNGLVNTLEQVAAKRRPTRMETLTYGTDKYDFSLGDQTFLPYERSTALKVSKSGNVSRYNLDIFGVQSLGTNDYAQESYERWHRLEVGDFLTRATAGVVATIGEQIQYRFDLLGGRQVQHLISTVSLSSREMGTGQLQRFLKSQVAGSRALNRLHRATKDILDAKSR